MVDMAFGTGAVKITPAHDHNDYDCGMRHKLPFVEMMDDNGVITDVCPQFQVRGACTGGGGLSCSFMCIRPVKTLAGNEEVPRQNSRSGSTERERFVQRNEGTFYGGSNLQVCQENVCVRKREREREGSFVHVGVFLLFSRSKDIVEPLIKPQWWVRCSETAQRAVEVREICWLCSLSCKLCVCVCACACVCVCACACVCVCVCVCGLGSSEWKAQADSWHS